MPAQNSHVFTRKEEKQNKPNPLLTGKRNPLACIDVREGLGHRLAEGRRTI